jgi:hypothetical protein
VSEVKEEAEKLGSWEAEKKKKREKEETEIRDRPGKLDGRFGDLVPGNLTPTKKVDFFV